MQINHLTPLRIPLPAVTLQISIRSLYTHLINSYSIKWYTHVGVICSRDQPLSPERTIYGQTKQKMIHTHRIPDDHHQLVLQTH